MLTGWIPSRSLHELCKVLAYCVWHKMQSAVSYMFSLLFGSISTLKLHQELHKCACLESR